MKNSLSHQIVVAIVVLTFISCGKMAPAGFWKTYKKEYMYRNISDQGPYGGYTDIAWYNGAWFSFSANDAIHFATKHNWEVTDSIMLLNDSSGTEMSKIKNAYTSDIIYEKVLPGLDQSETAVYVFKTNWLAIEPGNTSETFENGFITINRFGTLMTVYHIWGE